MKLGGAVSYRAAAALVPGLVLAASLAAAAFGLRLIPGVALFSPMILAMVLGMAVKNTVGAPAVLKPGITFSLKRLLRLAIMLLGLQLTFTQVLAVGGRGLLIILAVMAASYLFTVSFGRLIGVDGKLSRLIAAGTSICGASAVIAANTVVKAEDEDVAYAVASVTIFGSLAVLLYPLTPALLDLTPRAFGLWSGASIHEIAQVVAAAFQDGKEAGEFATVAKLTRVMLLAPLVIGMGLWAARGQTKGEVKAKAPLPLFVFGFIALVAVNSVWPLSPAAKPVVVLVTQFLLALSLAAMGLETDLRKLKAKGLRPLALGAAAWVFIGALALALVKLAY
ncbi:MAG: YeiH family protein [Caulobacteraceae bacterium]